MNKKLISIVGIVGVIAIVVFILNSFESKNTNKPIIKIGATLPLTGDVAMLGQNSKKAIELALRDLGNTKYSYEVVYEDDQFKPQNGATTANKLMSVDIVSALLSFGSPVGNVVSPIAEKQKVPHINFFASDMRVADGVYNFVNYTPPYNDAKLFVKEAQKRGIKNIILFEVQDNPGAAAITQALEKEIKGTDIKIVANKKFNTGTRDFRTLVSETKNIPADAYVLQASSPELEILYKQMREMDIKTPVTSIETFEFSSELSLFEGSWYISAADPREWFVNEYTKTYNDSPKFGAANGYDSLNIIVNAIEKVGNGKTVPTREQIREAIQNTKSFDGALGENLKFDTDGVLASDAVVRIVKDGKSVTISR